MNIAIDQGYDYVICGHIHQPKIRGYENSKGSVIYMNSGDWVENLTALEYDGEEWSMYKYSDEDFVAGERIEKIIGKSRKNLKVRT